MIFLCTLILFLFPVTLNPPDGPALSLDINQPAANPAALAMAILNSAKSRRRPSSNPQVPLVIISQPLPGPITGQNSPAPQVTVEKMVQSAANAAANATVSAATSQSDLQTEVVLEINQIVTDPDESPGDVARSSTDMTSLPLTNDQPTVEPTVSEDTPTPEEEQVVAVVSV